MMVILCVVKLSEYEFLLTSNTFDLSRTLVTSLIHIIWQHDAICDKVNELPFLNAWNLGMFIYTHVC